MTEIKLRVNLSKFNDEKKLFDQLGRVSALLIERYKIDCNMTTYILVNEFITIFFHPYNKSIMVIELSDFDKIYNIYIDGCN